MSAARYGRDEDNGDDPDIGTAADPFTELLQWLAQKLEPDDLSVAESMLEHALRVTDTDTVVGDEPLNTAGRPRALATDRYDPLPIRRKGMDSRTAIRELQSIREAEREVQPVAGEVLGMDCASDVYKAGLRALGHNVTGLHPNACKTMFRYLRGQGAKPQLAMDETQKSFAEQFPGAMQLKVR